MGDTPPPPPGFSLDGGVPPRRRAASLPPAPPDGFTVDANHTASMPLPSLGNDSIVSPIDGDTMRLGSGRHLRLWGVDAPELRQQGWDRNGNPVPIGQQSTIALANKLNGTSSIIGQPVGESYGRPVAPVTLGSEDLGQSLARSGNVLAEPSYLANDPKRLFDYMQAERLARLNRLGIHNTFHQTPAEFRHHPLPGPDRETVAVSWNMPTPFAGMRPEDELKYSTVLQTAKTPDEITTFVTQHGFQVDPAAAAKWITDRDEWKSKGRGELPAYALYGESPKSPKALTDQGDGGSGAIMRGLGNGVLPSMLEETGAVVDTLGGTSNRENIWNSDRRLADIWSNNESQNESITGFDRMAHPYLSLTGELAGSLLLPFGKVRSTADLAKWGGGYGFASGFGQEGNLPERLTSGVVGAGAGALTTVVGTKALEALASRAGPALSRWMGRGVDGALADSVGHAEGVPVPPEGFVVDTAHAASRPVPGVIGEAAAGDVLASGTHDLAQLGGRLPNRTSEASIQPPLPNGNPVPPEGFTLDDPRSIAMGGDGGSSVSQDLPRQRDYLFPERPQAVSQPLTEAQRRAMAESVTPGDVLPIKANEIGSVEEAAARDAGRITPITAPNEKLGLTRYSIKGWNGADVPKLGPTDMVGWLRLNGGLAEQGGELGHMGLDNKARNMDFAGQEQRFGPLVNNDSGMNLDDAAMRAWEAGYFPDHAERPSVNEFLDALRDTHEGRNRRFLPEDHAEIDQFYGAQKERYALEQQRFETGQPVFHDKSWPADEPQPFPPVHAYEDWPAGGPDFAGSINLAKLETPQDISRALDFTNRRVGFDAATRGRVAHAETERLAGELGMTPERLLSRRKGQALNAEEALAARQILAKSGNELVNAAKKLQGLDNPGDVDLADFRQKWLRHVAIQEQVSGMTAEAGRALQQFRMAANSRSIRGEVLAGLVDGGGGRHRIQEAADALINAVESSPGQFNTLAEKLSKPRWRDKAVELWYNILLSGPQTHAANIVSNALTALGQFPEHAAAAGIGLGRRALTGAASDRVYGTELGARAFGLLQGTQEGIVQFGRAMRTGMTSDAVSKIEAHSQPAISGIKGDLIRVPTRALTAEDEFFKAIARRMELSGLAARQAASEGLKGKAAATRIAELTSNPPDAMLARSFDYARYITFQRPLSGLPQSISSMTQRHPALKFLIPFVRTPTNLLKFAVERSPAAPLLKEWRGDFMAGGARRDLAVAKAMVGTGFGMWMADLARQGVITGSVPSDPNKERLLRADGWQPNSVRIGSTYYSYNRLDPFASTIGVAADLATKQDNMTPRQLDQATGLLVASIMKSLGDRTWLSGISDFIGMLDDPQRNMPGYLKRQGASMLVPAISAQVAHAVDPVRRKTQTLGDEIQARVPGISSSLPAQRDVWGDVIPTDRLGPDVVSPVTMTKRRNDLVNKEMLRLNAPATLFPKSHTVKGQRIDYTPQEQDRLAPMAGKAAHDAILAMIKAPGWQQLNPDAQRKVIKEAIAGGRSDARASLPAATPPPPPSGFTIEGAAGGRNVYADLQRAIPGVLFTSGFRTPAYQADMRRRGYHPADNSGHLDGSAFDLLPPPGKSMAWLKGQVMRYDGGARLLPEGDHLHVTFPGYYGAPALGGAKGLRNPNAGMPPPPPGFKVDAR
jgi:endonuclease YncB( thermonuclease family)